MFEISLDLNFLSFHETVKVNFKHLNLIKIEIFASAMQLKWWAGSESEKKIWIGAGFQWEK